MTPLNKLREIYQYWNFEKFNLDMLSAWQTFQANGKKQHFSFK